MGLTLALAIACVFGLVLTDPGKGWAVGPFEDPETIIEEKCGSDWPDNRRMRLACIEQQKQVLKKLLESDGRIPIQDHMFVREKCAAEWPDDFRSRAKCEENQIEGYLRWQAPPPKGVSLLDYSVAIATCSEEWPDDFRRRAHCLEGRLAAVRAHPEFDQNGSEPPK